MGKTFSRAATAATVSIRHLPSNNQPLLVDAHLSPLILFVLRIDLRDLEAAAKEK